MMQQAALRLFKGAQVDEHNPGGISQDITERTIRHGYVLEPAIIPDEKLLDVIESVIGLSGEETNAGFHESWQVVQDESTEKLVLQQIVHYITTYDFEAMGRYHPDTVYVPPEILDLPAPREKIPLVESLKPGLDGKTIYIPPQVRYALPATEKQFTGHFPSGSSITAPDDLIVGVHWMNGQRRTDLDLSVIGESGSLAGTRFIARKAAKSCSPGT